MVYVFLIYIFAIIIFIEIFTYYLQIQILWDVWPAVFCLVEHLGLHFMQWRLLPAKCRTKRLNIFSFPLRTAAQRLLGPATLLQSNHTNARTLSFSKNTRQRKNMLSLLKHLHLACPTSLTHWLLTSTYLSRYRPSAAARPPQSNHHRWPPPDTLLFLCNQLSTSSEHL